MKSELEYLKDRLEFRYKLFMEWAFVDNRLIQDIKKYGKETNEIEAEIIRLTKQESKNAKS